MIKNRIVTNRVEGSYMIKTPHCIMEACSIYTLNHMDRYADASERLVGEFIGLLVLQQADYDHSYTHHSVRAEIADDFRRV